MSSSNRRIREPEDIFDRIMNLPVLRLFLPIYRKWKEVLLYLFFGGLTTLISIGSYWFFCRLGIDALLANLPSWVLAVLFAYVTNSIWVFGAKPSGPAEWLKQMLAFFGGRVATLLMEEAVLFAGIRLLGGNELAVKVIAQILVLVGNYIISKLLVFKKR